MRPHGRARVSSRNPQAFGVCDRCGFLYNHNQLQWQFDWAGASLINKRILVCDTCNDVPQQQLRSIVVPADPVPIQNPRTQDYINAEQNTRYTQGNSIDPTTNIPVPGGDVRITENDDIRVIQQTGEPPGGLNHAPGTDPNAPGNNNPGLPYDNTTVPLTGPLSDFTFDVYWTNSSDIQVGWKNNSMDVVDWVTVILD